MTQALYTVGKIVNTQGLQGELKVLSHTDFPEQRFAQGSKLLLVSEQGGTPIAVTVASSRVNKTTYVLRLEGYNHINDVEKYKGWLLKIDEQTQGELEEGQYYYHQIVGCRVVTEDGEEIGVISEILSPGANDVWTVKPAKGSPILLPVIDDVVLGVDIKEKTVTVRLLEGLI